MSILLFLIGVLSANAFSLGGVTHPSDTIKQEQINVYTDRVVIEQEGIMFAPVADSYSMGDLLPPGSHTLEIKVKDYSDVKIGDVISFYEPSVDKVIMHKVVDINSDESGWYCITKGTNNRREDPWKVRINNIKGKLVGVLI